MATSPTTSVSLSDLLCKENESTLKEQESPVKESQDENEEEHPCSVSESDDEYIQQLIEKEITFESNGSVSEDGNSLQRDSWLKCARLGSIHWVLSTRAFFGFQFTTAFLSLLYFDRFLSKRSIDNGKLWAIRLLSVACLSLAAKMEEKNAPILSKYHSDEFEFETNAIERMEILVLNTLDWKMGSITPFAYLHRFVAKFCIEFKDSRPKELVPGAVELILAIPKEMNLMDFRPSVIAFAAILAACDDQLTRNAMEMKMSVIPLLGSLEKEDVYSCYNLMQEIKMGKSKTPKSVLLSTNYSSPVDSVHENSSITSAVGSKRRLTYNDCDQHCPNPKNHRS